MSDKSNAKLEIWEKRADFEAAAKNLETWAEKLRGPGYEVYFQALQRRFSVRAVYVARAPHYALYEIVDRMPAVTR